jgi:hypothetical protein
MGRKKYFIDIETISVTQDTNSKRFGHRLVIGGTGFSIIIGLIITLLFFHFFDSPGEKSLQNQIDAYQMKYQILNKRINKIAQGVSVLQELDDNTYRVIYELDPLSQDMRTAGIGGSEKYSPYFLSENTKVAGVTLQSIDYLIRTMQVQQKSFEELELAAMEKEKMLASIPTIMPVSRDKIRITSLFGWRKNPFNRSVYSFHSGVDFAGKPGTPVYATGDGVVDFNSGRMSGYGVVVVINHGYGYKTLYAHLSKAMVKPGEKVSRGQIIGKVGRTGSATGPHLHYEVIKNGQKVNPMNYITSTLSREEYNNILDQAEELDK